MSTSTIVRRAARYPAVHLAAGFVWFCAMALLLPAGFAGFFVATAWLLVSLVTSFVAAWNRGRLPAPANRHELAEVTASGTRVLPWHQMTEAQKVDHLVLAHYYQREWFPLDVDEAHRAGHGGVHPMVPHTHTKKPATQAAERPPIAVGSRITHRVHGAGRVTWIDIEGRTATVVFDAPTATRTVSCLIALAACE